jgi:2-furoyl-CoA dehydrogenase large subunit
VSERRDPGSISSKWVGQSVQRREDAALLRGEAQFVDDLSPFPGTHEAAILRSPHAHARIVSISVERALALPGVRAVLTGADIGAVTNAIPNVLKAQIQYFPIAVDRVRYVGEAVAIAIATDRYLAEDALDLIDVEYAELPSVVEPATAAQQDAVFLHDGLGSNIVHRRSFRFGDPAAAFDRADRVVSLDIDYPRIMSTPIETYGVIANYTPSERRYTIWSNFQGPFIGHPLIAGALRSKTTDVRMLSAPSSGGSFGVKWGVFPYAILISAAARLARVPVKWIEDRAEHLSSSSSSTGRQSHIEGAFRSDGRLLGLRIRQLENVGAYLRPPEPSTLYRTHGNLNGPYDVRDIAVENSVVLTNQAPSGLNRGFGGPQYFFSLERLMEEAARQLRIDSVDLRQLNLVRPEAMPYRCASGGLLDGGDYPATLKQATDLAGYDQLIRDRDEARSQGVAAGIGIAVSVESSASSLAYVNAALTLDERRKSSDKSGGLAFATVSADAGGQFSIKLPTVPAGQGHQTVLAQIVADELGLAPGDIQVMTDLDTGSSDWSITSGNYANRFSGADTTAAVMAARRVAAKLRTMAAHALSCPADEIELGDGIARARTRNTSISLKKLAAWSHWNSSNMPAGMEGGISETGTFTPTTLLSPDDQDRVHPSLTTTLMCDVASVRIDRETGQIKIVKYVVVHDTGRLLNPALAEGQLRGGFAHGLGAALLERIVYDRQGNLLTGTFADYLCPLAHDLPPLTIGHAAYPTDQNETGARGIGDGSSMNPPICIANAIADAIGASHIVVPAGPPRLWEMMNPADIDPDAELNSAAAVKRDGGGAGMLAGDGEQLLSGSREDVWKMLLNVRELADIIPGCRELRELEPDVYEAKIVLAIAGMRSTYIANISLSDKIEPGSLRLSGAARGSLGFGRGSAQIRLVSRGACSTLLSYRYSADVGGRVAGVGHRMLDSVVRLLIAQFFKGLSHRLNPDATARSRTSDWISRLRQLLVGERVK